MSGRTARAAIVAVITTTVMCFGLTGPAVAATNGRIVFIGDVGKGMQIYSMRSNDGLGLRQITHFHAGTFIEFTAPSPDGKWIAFASDLFGGLHLYVIRTDGSDLRQLTHEEGWVFTAPNWSPDGTQIVFAQLNDDGAGIGVLDVASGQQLRLLTFGTDYRPAFSADGQSIYFESQRGGLISAIWQMDLDGRNKHRLTPRRLKAGGAAVSPDGQHIAFFSNENYPGPNDIYVMNTDGSGITRLTHSTKGHSNVWPNFSPDGGSITFTSTRPDDKLCCYAVWRMGADGSNQSILTANLTPAGCDNDNCVYPSWKAAS